MKRFTLISLFVLLIFSLVFVAIGSCQDKFPSHKVTIICPFGVGGGSDTFTRAFQKPFSEVLGVPVTVENVSGGGGLKGMIYAAQQPADGYTVFEFTTSHLIASALKRSDIDLFKDFIILARAQHDTSILWTAIDSEFKTFDDLLKWAKEHPYMLTIGGTSPMGYDDLRDRLFAKNFGIEMTFVPFEASSQAKTSVLGKFIKSHMEEPLAVKSLIESGKGKALISMSPKRLPIWPDVPCAAEYGVNDYMGVFRAFAVKKGTPPEIVEILEKTIAEALKKPEYVKFTESTMTNLRPGYLSGSEFLKVLTEEKTMFEEIAKDLGYLK